MNRHILRMGHTLLVISALAVGGGSAYAGPVSADTLQGKVLVGYQGFYRCPGDGSPEHQWSHWFREGQPPSAQNWDDDLFPDVSDMDKASLCQVPGITNQGKPVYVFSSFPKATTDTHFRWMRDYDIDGALIQRFVTRLPELHAEQDAVLQHASQSAREYGRVIAVEYDLTGSDPKNVLHEMQNDWSYLKNSVRITSQPSYLKQNGKPVVSLWGLGFGDKGHLQDPTLALQIVLWFKSQGNFVVGGVPAYWADLSHDSSSDAAWNAVYEAFDVIQPWTVGRYKTVEQSDAWGREHFAPELRLATKRGQMYMPVIFPGFSWHNRHPDAPQNAIPRMQGDLLWAQAVDARQAGATMLKIAMFDELNEGTAIMKVAPSRSATPEGQWVTLDSDGARLPSDWYLELTRKIAYLFHENVKYPSRYLPLTVPRL